MGTCKKGSGFVDPRWSVFAVLSILLVWPQSAHAYMDGGSMALIAQAIVATIFTLIGTSKLWWGKFMEMVRTDEVSDDDGSPGSEG